MFIASRGKSIANNGIRSAVGGSEQGQARKKARVEGTGASGTKIESSLRVDVNALRLPSPRNTRHGGCALVRSPIVFENTIGGDGSMDGTGDAATNMGESEEPFVIARKLLRRRHVRKEQHRKEKEAQEALYARELCNNRKRKGQSDRSGTRHPSMVFSVTPATSDSTIFTLPQLSPMLLKAADSFSDISRTSSPQGNGFSNTNQVWSIEVGDSPNVDNTSKFAFPRRDVDSISVTRVSFSPLRSRNAIM